jgi:hypothetical protein
VFQPNAPPRTSVQIVLNNKYRDGSKLATGCTIIDVRSFRQSAHTTSFKDARRNQTVFYVTEQDVTETSDARTLSSVELNLAEGRKKTESTSGSSRRDKTNE